MNFSFWIMDVNNRIYQLPVTSHQVDTYLMIIVTFYCDGCDEERREKKKLQLASIHG